ncbi:sugar transferase [Candidatus Gracilibacteria bacterium]|nr:sugar transferase [Candidatus Gracilibacteria bacterium]
MEKLFFQQERVGEGGAHFTLFKIQTMYPHEGVRVDENGRKNGDDEYIIPTRAWLRKTGLDEVPQIVNIILRDMNFFGARPTTPIQMTQFQEGERERYCRSKPGLIGPYLFFHQGGYCDQNPRKASDAYLRLRKMKEGKKKELFLMNLEALRRSLMAIVKGKHT